MFSAVAIVSSVIGLAMVSSLWLVGNHDNPQSVGGLNQLFAIDDERPPGLEDQGPPAVTMQVGDGLRPDGRHVKTRILVRLGHLDQHPSTVPAQHAPARSIMRSVPSIASTAMTSCSLTAIDCPMSSRPISLAIVQPNAMSFS